MYTNVDASEFPVWVWPFVFVGLAAFLRFLAWYIDFLLSLDEPRPKREEKIILDQNSVGGDVGIGYGAGVKRPKQPFDDKSE